MQVEVFKRRLRKVREGDLQLPGLRVWGSTTPASLTWTLKPSAVEKEAIAFAGQGLSRDRSSRGGGREARRREGQRSDLGEFRAVGFFVGAKLRFGVGAGGLAIGRVGVDREAGWQSHGRRAASPMARERSGSSSWGTFRSTSRPEAVSVCGSRRLGEEARVEAELIAAGRRRVGGIRLGQSVVVGEDFDGGAQRHAAGGRIVEERRVLGAR